MVRQGVQAGLGAREVRGGARRGRGGRGGVIGRGSEAPSVAEPVAGPSNIAIGRRGLMGEASELALVRVNQAKSKRAQLSAKAEFKARKNKMQVERMLLPDAPLRKRDRKDSPERTPCRLMPFTPAVPPPPQPQPWQIKQQQLQEQQLQEQQLQEQQLQEQQLQQQRPHSSPQPSSLLCDWTYGGLRAEGDVGALARAQSPVTITLSIPESELGGVPAEAATLCRRVIVELNEGAEMKNASKPHSPRAEPNINTLEDSNRLFFNDDDDDVVVVEELDIDPASLEYTIDFANDAPADLPDHIHEFERDFLQEMDHVDDQWLTGLLNYDEADNLTFDWNADPTTFTGHAERFDSDSGPTFPVIEKKTSPSEIFRKYFDEEVMNLIVDMTNLNLERHQSRPLQEHSRFQKAKKTTMDEMYVFIAVLILQGVLPLPVEKDYFFENGLLTLKYFKTVITYDRFIFLKRILHFTDSDLVNTGTETTATVTGDNQKLRKLGPLLNLLRSRFRGLYLPERNIAIDESLLKWHGRLSFAQKIATKAAKVGIKTYELCESRTGYCWDFFVYTGKGQIYGHTDTDRPEPEEETETNRQGGEIVPNSATAKIVLELVQPLLNKGHTLVMDNFFNSPLLARYLKTKRTDCFGTLRVNRKFVPEAIKSTKKSQMRQGECIVSYCRDLTVTLWRDANVVAMISTRHRGEVGGTEKWGRYKYKPQVVLDYNQTMGGVDRKDQLLSSHPIERARNEAWYKKVFRRLLNVAVLNAYICYKTANPSSLQRSFRTDLAEELIGMTSIRPITRPIRTVQEVDRQGHKFKEKRERPVLVGNHFICTGPYKAARCVLCKTSRSKYICKQCRVTLCCEPCFELYHT